MANTATKEKKETKAKRPDTFVFVAPTQPNTKFLVRRGEEVAPGENELNRQDISAEFNSGICVTKDPEVLTWLVAHEALVKEEVHADYHLDTGTDPDLCPHRGVCMNAENESVAFWADQMGRTQNLSNRPAQLDSGYDVEKALQGKDPLSGVPDTLMDRAYSAMAAARGGDRSLTSGKVTSNHPEQFHEGAEQE